MGSGKQNCYHIALSPRWSSASAFLKLWPCSGKPGRLTLAGLNLGMKKPLVLTALAVLVAGSAAFFQSVLKIPTPASGVSANPTNTGRPTRGVTREETAAKPIRAEAVKGIAELSDDQIFAGGSVRCDCCGATADKLELRHIPDARGRIACILESLKGRSGLSGCDPRVAQLIALGDGSVDELLEALDTVNAEQTRGGKYRGGARSFALQFALEQLLTEKDKEIILTYFEERAYFKDLAVKFAFAEAGEIALRRLQGRPTRSGSSFSSSADAGIAAALYPSEAIPFMLEQMKKRPFLADSYIVALAEKAPQVDLREPLTQAIRSPTSSYSSSKLAPLALERGLPEGFDAALRVLRDVEMSYAQERLLGSVRKYTGFTGTAEQTARWIEQNRQRLSWSESGKMFVMR